MPSGASAVGFAIAANSLDQGRFGSSCFGNKPSMYYSPRLYKPVTVTSLHPPHLCRIAVFSIKPTFFSQTNVSLLCRVAVFLIPIITSLSMTLLAEISLDLW